MLFPPTSCRFTFQKLLTYSRYREISNIHGVNKKESNFTEKTKNKIRQDLWVVYLHFDTIIVKSNIFVGESKFNKRDKMLPLGQRVIFQPGFYAMI